MSDSAGALEALWVDSWSQGRWVWLPEWARELGDTVTAGSRRLGKSSHACGNFQDGEVVSSGRLPVGRHALRVDPIPAGRARDPPQRPRDRRQWLPGPVQRRSSCSLKVWPRPQVLGRVIALPVGQGGPQGELGSGRYQPQCASYGWCWWCPPVSRAACRVPKQTVAPRTRFPPGACIPGPGLRLSRGAVPGMPGASPA